MRSKTNFNAVQELMARYSPAQRGIVSNAEADLIRSVLELDRRNGLELDDIRDAVVMLYGQTAGQAEKVQGVTAMMDMMDAMSGATAVIDQEKACRALPGQAVVAYTKPPRYAVADAATGHFMSPSAKTPFSPDPERARKWPTEQDAAVMAKYAEKQFGRPMATARIETVRTVFPTRPAPNTATKGGPENG